MGKFSPFVWPSQMSDGDSYAQTAENGSAALSSTRSLERLLRYVSPPKSRLPDPRLAYGAGRTLPVQRSTYVPRRMSRPARARVRKGRRPAKPEPLYRLPSFAGDVAVGDFLWREPNRVGAAVGNKSLCSFSSHAIRRYSLGRYFPLATRPILRLIGSPN
jgi:hypothetical protein